MAARKKAEKRGPAKRTRKAAKKRAVKKRPARRAAPRKAAKKRAVKKRPARRAAPRKAAKKRVVKKRPARRAAPRKAAKKRAVKKRPVTRRASAPRARTAEPVAAAFEAQKAGASVKDLLLFEIERGGVAVLAAIQGLGSGSAMQPVGEGKWTIHETVLHLATRDRARLDEFEAMLAGNAASWAGIDDPAYHAESNERNLAPLRDLSWDEAVRLLMTTRAELVDRLQAVPAEPETVWSESHPFGAIMRRLPGHDRGHAEKIKSARVAG